MGSHISGRLKFDFFKKKKETAKLYSTKCKYTAKKVWYDEK